MIQRCTNHPSHSESFNVVQIFQHFTNHSRSHKLCKEVKYHSTLFKTFNVVQIIQRNTYHSTQYKLFNVVQIIHRSANFQRCINHYWMLYKSFKLFSRSPYYLRFCHIAILKKFNTSHLYGNIIKTSRNSLV